ncbi:hypothetical protein SAY86_004234 [Trapa natans]|uniref:Uncharacterized protein n=1 Tax=Trapa natans TaxID=22666 RepID=A0AAN7MFF1_TRANT|nr:hypothetical protein SAY86_004234 [Trapa natans]
MVHWFGRGDWYLNLVRPCTGGPRPAPTDPASYTLHPVCLSVCGHSPWLAVAAGSLGCPVRVPSVRTPSLSPALATVRISSGLTTSAISEPISIGDYILLIFLSNSDSLGYGFSSLNHVDLPPLFSSLFMELESDVDLSYYEFPVAISNLYNIVLRCLVCLLMNQLKEFRDFRIQSSAILCKEI